MRLLYDRGGNRTASRRRPPAGSVKEKPVQMNRLFLDINPATSYFPTTESCSIIGSSRLNFRVRDGNGCDPTDNITGKPVGSGRWRLAVKETAECCCPSADLKIGRCLNFSIQGPYLRAGY